MDSEINFAYTVRTNLEPNQYIGHYTCNLLQPSDMQEIHVMFSGFVKFSPNLHTEVKNLKTDIWFVIKSWITYKNITKTPNEKGIVEYV